MICRITEKHMLLNVKTETYRSLFKQKTLLFWEKQKRIRLM